MPYEQIGKNEPVCIADEVPFDIPDSWEWVRLSSIALLNPRNDVSDDIDAAFIPMTLLKDGYNNEHNFEVKKWKEIKSGFTHFAENDIVVAKITPCFQNRKSAILCNLPNGIGAGTTELHVVRRIIRDISNDYLLWIFKSAYFIDNGVKAFSGTAGQQRIGKPYMESLLIPMPPANEQKRIANKLQEIMPLCIAYESAHNTIVSLNADFPIQLKKSILQEAVMGKLVPQDENDEPASVLLERIREEKQRLIAEGKIKKDKNESIIFRRDNSHYEKLNGIERCIDDEIPFDIPDNWCWCRLADLVYNHGQLAPSDCFSYIDIGSINNEIQQLSKDDNIISPDKAPSRARKIVKYGDILYSTVRPYLHNMCIIDREFSRMPIASTGFAVMSCHEGVHNKFLFYYLLSPIFDSYVNDNENSKGVAYPAINDKRLYCALIPLPPLNEQHRIVEQLNTVIPQCEKL